MDGLTSWMERHILPVAAKIGAQKHLVALRDYRNDASNDGWGNCSFIERLHA